LTGRFIEDLEVPGTHLSVDPLDLIRAGGVRVLELYQPHPRADAEYHAAYQTAWKALSSVNNVCRQANLH